MASNTSPIIRIDKFRNVETVQKPATASPTRTVLPVTESLRGLQLVLSGTCTEGGSAGGTLTTEAVLSLIREITIEATSSSRREIGKIKKADFAAMYRLAHLMKGVAPSYLDPTPITKSAAASPFRAVVPIDFEFLQSQDPRQTLLNSTELTSLSLIVDWGDASDLFSTGSWTFPTCSLEINAKEFTDDFSKSQKYGLNQLSYIQQVTTATNSRLAIDLKRGYLLRGLLIKQFTATGYPMTPVSSVINSVSLELNREVRKKMSWTALQALNMEQYQIATMPTGYAFLDFMPEGRFDTIIDTRVFRDVYVILDVTGVGSSYVRVYPIEIIPAIL
jgi:hypothetical protein